MAFILFVAFLGWCAGVALDWRYGVHEGVVVWEKKGLVVGAGFGAVLYAALAISGLLLG